MFSTPYIKITGHLSAICLTTQLDEGFYLWRCHSEVFNPSVNSIYCSITVNHRLTGPGIMVKLCLLFMGKSTNNNAIDIPNC